jgi:hypothetical protein
MADANLLAAASAGDIKTLVLSDAVTHADAIARVDAVLSRKVLTDGKRARWMKLREWIVTNEAEANESVSS